MRIIQGEQFISVNTQSVTLTLTVNSKECYFQNTFYTRDSPHDFLFAPFIFNTISIIGLPLHYSCCSSSYKFSTPLIFII